MENYCFVGTIKIAVYSIGRQYRVNKKII